jgi:hypothetical protein
MMQNQTAENDDSTFNFLGKDNKQFTVRRLLGSELGRESPVDIPAGAVPKRQCPLDMVNGCQNLYD